MIKLKLGHEQRVKTLENGLNASRNCGTHNHVKEIDREPNRGLLDS